MTRTSLERSDDPRWSRERIASAHDALEKLRGAEAALEAVRKVGKPVRLEVQGALGWPACPIDAEIAEAALVRQVARHREQARGLGAEV